MTLAEIQQEILASRGGAHGSWPWTARMLAHAGGQFGGVWRQVPLTGAAALAVRLPPHAGEPCHGDRLAIVDDGGASVGDTARRLAAIGASYGSGNPSCTERMARAAGAPFSAVVLTTAPLGWEEYARVTPVEHGLYCIDGFHRLVAWAAAGRLVGDVTLPAWVAGPPGGTVRS